MGTGYSDLSSNDYRPPPDWSKSASARHVYAQSLAIGFGQLACRFEEIDRTEPLAEHRLRDKAGQMVIAAFARGFLQSIPNLGKFVSWHTASDAGDPVVGIEVDARRVRCPGNLFIDLIGGHMVNVRLEVDGRITPLGPKLDDGILPAMAPDLFERGNGADACRFLSREIEREANMSGTELPYNSRGRQTQLINPSLPADARQLADRIREVPKQVVASFKNVDQLVRRNELSDVTGQILFDGFDLVTWIERNRPGSAGLEKSRFFSLQDQAIACAGMDIPEYAGGEIHEQETPGPISEGARLTAELLVFCEMFAGAVRGWASEIETVLAATKSIAEGPWSRPDSPSRWAKVFDISRDTLMRRFRDNKIRHKKLSSKSYCIHVDDLPSGQK